jgi:CheY-like chemotaxis protein/HPt (histidine-containing phosphotransfer) domain-containing protein
LIQTDPTRLRQILVNLLGNAIKFTEAGKITVHVSDEGAGGGNILLRVDVVDSGIGMTPEQVQRLFRPFSRRLAQLLNGDISVMSELGVGSTFSLKIDGGSSAGVEMLKDLSEARLPTTPGRGERTTIRFQGRILLVEDGRDNQRLLRMHLTAAGADVVVADNGQIAVDMATKEPFDLILMDMQMPVMDGYAATTELRRRGFTTPIIALTAHAMAEDRAKCIASGCSDYLSKPIPAELLLKTVRRHLIDNRPPQQSDAAAIGISPTPLPSLPAADGGRIKSSLADYPGMTKIIPEFVEGLPGEVRKMLDLLQRNDLGELQRVVHQLRGASGGYGFEPVTEPATKTEQLIKAGQPVESVAPNVQSLIDVIRRIDGYNKNAEKLAA